MACEASRFIQAGALDPDLMFSDVLAISLSPAISGQLEALRARVSGLEEQPNSPPGLDGSLPPVRCMGLFSVISSHFGTQCA